MREDDSSSWRGSVEAARWRTGRRGCTVGRAFLQTAANCLNGSSRRAISGTVLAVVVGGMEMRRAKCIHSVMMEQLMSSKICGPLGEKCQDNKGMGSGLDGLIGRRGQTLVQAFGSWACVCPSLPINPIHPLIWHLRSTNNQKHQRTFRWCVLAVFHTILFPPNSLPNSPEGSFTFPYTASTTLSRLPSSMRH